MVTVEGRPSSPSRAAPDLVANLCWPTILKRARLTARLTAWIASARCSRSWRVSTAMRLHRRSSSDRCVEAGWSRPTDDGTGMWESFHPSDGTRLTLNTPLQPPAIVCELDGHDDYEARGAPGTIAAPSIRPELPGGDGGPSGPVPARSPKVSTGRRTAGASPISRGRTPSSPSSSPTTIRSLASSSS